jgi:hypothetical protein
MLWVLVWRLRAATPAVTALRPSCRSALTGDWQAARRCRSRVRQSFGVDAELAVVTLAGPVGQIGCGNLWCDFRQPRDFGVNSQVTSD